MSEVSSASSEGFDSARASVLRLSMVAGVGPRTFHALLERFGSAEEALQASVAELKQVDGVGEKLAGAIQSGREIDLERETQLCREHGVRQVFSSDSDFPRLLREIHTPPAVLYVKGELAPADNVALAIVGTRHATHYGKAQAERLSGAMARAGLTVISGLARGIDAIAHRAALAAGGRTIAVLGNGLSRVYPPEHADLAGEIAGQGAVVSELPMTAEPKRGSFPQRNRLISGLTLGVLVVEAAHKSGALITARHALEQGRDVFAVPGRVDNRMSHGCHQLIRDGAKLVERAEDILEELGPLVEAAPTAQGQVIKRPAELMLNQQESKVLALVGEEPTAIDQVIHESQLAPHQVLATISVLEIRHLIRRLDGNHVVRK